RSSRNASILFLLPVSSMTRESLLTSTTFARKISATAKKLSLCSTVVEIFTRIISLHTLSSGSRTLISRTSTSLASCLVICSRISSSPVQTTVIRENLGSAVSPTERLSILYPLRLNRPAIRLNVPETLSTNKDKTLLFSRSEEHTSELQSRFDLVCRL